MAFKTLYDGIALRLKGLKFAESLEAVDFKNAPATEYGNTFILKALSGEQPEETIIDRVFDNQEWQVQIAFAKNANSDIIQLAEAHRQRDLIIADLDDPASWSSFARLIKYKSWEMIDTPNYFILDLRFQVKDTYTY